MNNELPKVDITYGTKRTGDRNYKGFLFSIVPAIKGAYSVEVTTIDGNIFSSNILKCNSRSKIIVFSDRRMLFCQLAKIKFIPRREFDIIESKIEFFDKVTLLRQKTFNLILNKAYAVGKSIAIFMKNGEIYKGVCHNRDYDSVMIINANEDREIIMYDAIKRIVPLEADGTLAE